MNSLVIFILAITSISGQVVHNDIKSRFITNKTLENNTEIVVLIHSWMESWHKEWYTKLTDALLSKNENYAILYIDWSSVAHQLLLDEKSMKDVGDIIAEILIATEHPVEQITLIGFAFGARVASYVGKAVLGNTGEKLGRFIALDPQIPFKSTPITKQDAEIVIVIHTTGPFTNYGHVDIYPNGGIAPQSGCISKPMEFCSEKKSIEIYLKALRYKGNMMATECLNYVLYTMGRCSGNQKIDIGETITLDMAGVYFLKTD